MDFLDALRGDGAGSSPQTSTRDYPTPHPLKPRDLITNWLGELSGKLPEK